MTPHEDCCRCVDRAAATITGWCPSRWVRIGLFALYVILTEGVGSLVVSKFYQALYGYVIMDFVLSGLCWVLWDIMLALVKYLLSWLCAGFDLYIGFVAYATLALHCAFHCDWPRTLRRFARFRFDAVMRDTDVWEEYKARSRLNLRNGQRTGERGLSWRSGDAPYLLTMDEFKPGYAYTKRPGRRSPTVEDCHVCASRGRVDEYVQLAGLNFHPHCIRNSLDPFLYERYRLLYLMAPVSDLCGLIVTSIQWLSCAYICEYTWAMLCEARVDRARVAAAKREADNPGPTEQFSPVTTNGALPNLI